MNLNAAQIRNLLYNKNFSRFLHRAFLTTNPGASFFPNWHIDAISEYLMAVKDGQVKRLIINMPPRFLKSVTVSVAYPAWLLGLDPTKKIICASYSQKLAIASSVQCRDVMESDWFMDAFPECRFSKDQNEKTQYVTTKKGMRFSTSIGGTLTGFGADVIICDDPLNPNQAASDVERDNANTFMDSTLPSRLNDQATGAIIVVMQRLHEDDVTGHLLAKGGWEHLCLPAKNDTHRVISINNFKKEFHKGELLHAEKLPNSVLDQLSLDMGSLQFAGQYLQQPMPTEGGILKARWWSRWEKKDLPSLDFTLQVYDTAFKTGDMNDYSARTTWGIFRDASDGSNNIILIEAMNKRLTLPELRVEVLASYKEYNPDIVLIEDKASGISLIQELKRLRIRLRAMQRGKGDDKVSRAHVASVVLEQGVVWYPKEKAWANEVIRQCATFPQGKHDDLVDTVTDALIFLRSYKQVILKTDDNWDETPMNNYKPTYKGYYG